MLRPQERLPLTALRSTTTRPTPPLTVLAHHSYGGREQALQEQAKASGGQLLGEAKEGMGAVEAKGREVVREGREMMEKVGRGVGK